MKTKKQPQQVEIGHKVIVPIQDGTSILGEIDYIIDEDGIETARVVFKGNYHFCRTRPFSLIANENGLVIWRADKALAV